MSSTNVTSIEEIVKYQQELLNHQRNQKLIQKETIKLLNALNKSLSLMSDRLDEFATKTNIKLEDNFTTFNQHPNQHQHQHQQLQNVNTSMTNTNNSYTLVPSHVSSSFIANSSSPSNDVIYLTAENLNNSINSICSTVNTTLSSLNTNNPMFKNSNNNHPTTDIKELFILNDFNSNILEQATNTSLSHLQHMQHQPTILFNGTKLNTIKINNNTNYILTPTLNSINLASNQHQQKTSKLLDTTNTTNGNKTSTSDESIGAEMESYEETSDEEKESIQSKKKSKINANSKDSPQRTKTKECEESNNQQRLFNKFVRESVERRLGKEFLLLHEIQEIDHEIMEEIKKEALEAYPPVNIRPRRAWHLAKASLRCRRRSLRRQKEKQILNSSSLAPGSVSSTSSSSVSTTPKLENQSRIDSNIIQSSLGNLSSIN